MRLCLNMSPISHMKQLFFIFNTRDISLNRKDFQASTLVVLTQENPALDPPAVLHLNN